MNLMKRCPLFLFLVLSGLILSLAGIIGSSTIYGKLDFDWKKNPYISLVLKGLEQGVYPWEAPLYDQIGIGEGLVSEKNQINLNEILLGKDAEEVMNSGILEDNKTFAKRHKSTSEEAGQQSGQEIQADQSVSMNQTETEQEGQGQSQDVSSGEIQDQPLAFEPVTEDYFNDALFIGDSRTVGMFEYGGLETRAQFYAKTSLTIYGVLEAELAADPVTGQKISVEEALMKQQFGKIYLMLGINEMGTGTVETFAAQYAAVVSRIRELQPNAVIFIQSIMNVSAQKSSNDAIFNNQNILARNTELAKLADQKHVFYLNVNEVVTDQDGNLIADYTGDGIHLKAAYYELWKELLLKNGIVRK